jgi:hypothetical protein
MGKSIYRRERWDYGGLVMTDADLPNSLTRLTFHGPLPDLAGLADLAVGAGFRPAWFETATQQEWDDFESGYQCDEEEWLADHADHPEAARIRKQVDEHRSFYLRGYRGVLGLAYLTLVPVA